MPTALSNALSSPSVVAAANKAGFDLNNPANVSRLLAYAGVSGFQLKTEKTPDISASEKSSDSSIFKAALIPPAVHAASQQTELDLFVSAQSGAARAPNAYVKNALSMYAQIAAMG